MAGLAIFGGDRAVKAPEPHFTWPRITDAMKRAVLRQMDESLSIYDRSGAVERLEDLMQRTHRAPRALVVNSGTSALHSLYVGAGLGPGDEVVCPAYTFFATVTPLLQTGAWPVLADCGPDGNLDVEEARGRITPATKAIMLTHMWGMPCDLDAFRRLARERGLLLFEDSSHAYGATFRGEPVGCLGDGGALSLQSQKPLPGGEGGVLLTRSDEIYYRALTLGHYNRRCRNEIPREHELARFAVTGMGLKLRIHPLACAIAEHQAERLPPVLAGRRKTVERLRDGLRGLPGILFPEIPDHVEPSWYALTLQYRGEELDGLPVERLHEALRAEGCAEIDRPGSTRPLSRHALFQDPGALFPMYRGRKGYSSDDFPRADALHRRTLKLPVWHEEQDVGLVDQYINAFHKVVGDYKRLLQ